MDKEVWALVGVVVGGLLGGGAQVLAEFLRSRNDRKRDVANRRQQAYAEFIAAAHALILSASQRDGHDRYQELSRTQATVMLLAPGDTYASAREMSQSAIKGRAETTGRKVDEPYRDARNIKVTLPEFLALAKRDLGIEDDSPLT